MSMPPLPAMPAEVQTVFDACTAPVRQGLVTLRGLVFAQADRMPQIGPVTEALRWGEPAFLTLQTGAACSLRIGPVRRGGFGLFVHCKSGLIPAFQAGLGSGLRFDGTRAVLFETAAAINAAQISLLIEGALGFHLAKKRRSPAV